MNIQKVKVLIDQGESETLEFKKSTAKLSAIFETVCAFLNGKGGTVIIGATDNGKIVGQDVTDATRQEIANHIAKIEPSAQSKINVGYVAVEKGKQIIILKADDGNHAPYIYDSRSFYRNQSTTSKMPQHHYEQLLVERGQLNHSWEDAIATEYTLDDLDHEEIHRTLIDGIAERRIPPSIAKERMEKILRQLELIIDEKPKCAAVALFGKEIKSRYTQCWLKMARFKRTDKLGDFIDNQQIHCNVFRMLEEADNFLRKHLPIASYFKPDQFKRIDKPALPVLAVREALVNAICHRNYMDRSGYISIAIFDDRVEIWNNGTLPRKLKLVDLKRKHDSILRNILIAKVFYLRGYIEAWGTGTTRMVELCKENAIPAPKFSERTDGLVVTFKFADPIGVTTRQNAIGKTLLSLRQDEILCILQDKKLLSANEIFSKLNKPPSLRTVKADLTVLQKIGLVEQEGKGPSTIWKIKS